MSRLRSAREARGWSQLRLVREIERRLRAAGTLSVTPASLKVYVSEWENGRRSIGADYRAVLRGIFGLTDAELFDDDAPGVDLADAYTELAQRIALAESIDHRMAETLAQQTELMRTMDRQLGAPAIAEQMRAHLKALDDALAYAVLPRARRPVARVLSSASTLAGWQALDVGAVDRAWRHYETARRAAEEASSAPLLAHAMGEQAYVLVDLGHAELAVELIREALNTAAGKSPARLTAWLRAAEAELCALAGAGRDGRAALELAAAALPDGSDERDEDVSGLFLNGAHLARWRGNVLAMLGDGNAIGDLYGALERMDGTFTRAAAGLRIGLAQAHFARDEIAEAQHQAQQARLIVNRTGSLRQRRRLDRLAGLLPDGR
ncbi:hypothetical protein GCM10009557_26880 [Virgisporangium ochraceum]|uniref:Uncharacterized protein n=1 Tax=Virgisporangium ochraceum TaxID=65505 RepID=A0A8J4E7Z3_9ACTN|nr:hypothetical protein Voc01_005520 [Virgisporangium ochraceum]